MTGATIGFLENEAFEPPDDVNARVWRYMDLAKLISLLSRRELFFARADMLADQFEGALFAGYGTLDSPQIVASEDEFGELFRNMREWFRRGVVISSWHLNEVESMAMWEVYARRGAGVAITSTYARLIKSFPDWDEPLHVGVVRYIDYEKGVETTSATWLPFVTKRRPFDYERELRVVTTMYPAVGDEPLASGAQPPAPGAYVPVALTELVEAVHLAPSTPTWVEEVVVDVAARYGLEAPVERSSLEREPRY